MTSRTTNGNYRAYQGPARHQGAAPNLLHVPDARLVLIASLIPDIFTSKRILDIGCNTGVVSTQLAIDFNAASVHGVDIDSSLIDKAEYYYLHRSSRVLPATAETAKVPDYFPLSAVLDAGVRAKHAKDDNVFFVAEDWVTSSDHTETAGPFDTILALSLVKWLHLKHGDDGLRNFFDKCARTLAAGGHLVIEPQPWVSYEKAIAQMKAPQYQESFKSLKLRPDDFPRVLKEVGFDLVASSTALARDIFVYKKA
ncbi:Bin3-domain-containing protein [Pseudovirgaria hyperparasitica]|uniref:RNA methyltransferase n=1 Tax=Pseudovirgaria hyperparasitica TaxID=470096 RepID=A0A6A6WM61_9PEZI|nr:Bin3-domain-containing protein [Pseudovirgaria hyperparasitica]KAF2763294.1 Bin3-domain-containing protein [Pseudovirgaria hyperparasitica]